MLTLTNNAADYICSLLNDANAPENVSARILFEESSFAMKFDQLAEEDTTFEHKGRTVLVLDEQASSLLSDRTLDLKATEAGPQLVFSESQAE